MAGIELYTLLQQVFVDIDDATAWKYLVELVALQLVVTRAATHHHGFDIKVIERVGHTVKQHTVVGNDFFSLVKLTTAALRITTTQITRRQHSLHARMPEHGLGRETYLAKQTLRATTGEIEHGLGVRGRGLRVANDGHIVFVFNIQQSARCFLGQIARHLLVDEVDDLLLDGRSTHRGRRRIGLLARDHAQHIIGKALQLHAHIDHSATRELDSLGIGSVEHQHRSRIAGPECFLAHLAQEVAHIHGHLTKVNLHRARREALVADGAMVGHVFKFLPVLDGHTTTGLFFVQEGLDQQRSRQNFVTRAVEQVRTRHMGGADWLALATAQTVFHAVGNRTDVRLLHDERLVAHQTKTGGVGLTQISVTNNVLGCIMAQQFAFVETPLRIDPLLVVGKRLQLSVCQKLKLGDADAMLARDNTVE